VANRKMTWTIVAMLTIAGGITAATASEAATPECGVDCLSVFSSELGSYASPNFVEHVFGGTAEVGRRTGLAAVNPGDSSADFINPHPGTVADYYALGLVSQQVARHYGSLSAAQLEYSPLGLPSGLCVGIAANPFQGEALSLQPCTVPGRTVWIVATALSPTTAPAGLFPIVSGATKDFDRPFAMTYPVHTDTSQMLPPIRLRHLRFRGVEHLLPPAQLWGVHTGPLL
jgi:hypothetical protein